MGAYIAILRFYLALHSGLCLPRAQHSTLCTDSAWGTKFQGLNLDKPHAKQAPNVLYYLSSHRENVVKEILQTNIYSLTNIITGIHVYANMHIYIYFLKSHHTFFKFFPKNVSITICLKLKRSQYLINDSQPTGPIIQCKFLKMSRCSATNYLDYLTMLQSPQNQTQYSPNASSVAQDDQDLCGIRD